MSFEQGASLDGGRYELQRRIGSGGMASVWLAQDTRLQRPVAIKIPTEGLAADPVFTQRFEREARLAASLSHPHLVPVYDYGCEVDRPYLVMEYIDGESLAELREWDEPVDGAALARALLGALEPIHAAGIVHRDVKPGNVLVERGSGRILLTDFGIAQAAEATQLTGTGQVIGTLRYIAPEVMNGERASARSDLYACGVLLAEFLGPEDPPALKRLAAELSADDPAERPGSATSALALAPSPDFVDAVERTTAHLEPSEPVTLEQSAPEPSPPLREEAVQGEVGVDDRSGGELQPHGDTAAGTGAVPRPTPPRTPASVTRSAPAVAASRDRLPDRSAASGPGLMPRIVLGFAILAAAVAIVVAVSSSGEDEPSRGGQAAKEQQQGGGGAGPAEEETAPVEEAAPVEGLPEPSPTPDPALGAQLNDEGKALIDAGDPAGAVPILERAVASYPADSSEIAYGYALFNYAQALRLSGQPEAAIPVLERRMQIDDQLDVVEAELDLARQEAGEG